jgi:hypothetical protein
MLRLSRPLGLAGLIAAACMVLPSSAAAQTGKLSFIADMDASQIITGSTSPARGTACAVMDPVANTLEVRVVIDGIVGAETFTHIHGFAPPGSGAPPQFTFAGGLVKHETWNYPEAFEAQIINELAYVKLHSSVFPTGELRGQLKRVQADAVLVADMDDAQIVVANPVTPARGLTCLSMNTQTNMMTYQMTWNESMLLPGETETASHIHGYVPAGAGGPPQHTMPLGFHKNGTWQYPEANEADLLNGLSYSKVHTTLNPTGLIRGQNLVQSLDSPDNKICLVADMDAAQIITGSTSPARGTACAVMDTTFNTLEVSVLVDQLVGVETFTHIHGFAPPGSGAPPQYTFAGGLEKRETWVYPEAVEEAILDNLSYVKLHSSVFPTGELRGQLNRVVADATLVANQDAPQIVVAPSTSAALGLFCASLDLDTNLMSYQMTFTSSLLLPGEAESATHIHGYALPGAGAPPQHTLSLGFHKTGTWNYPEVNEADILGGLSYSKVHTNLQPTGVIRGNNLLRSRCLPTATNYCTAGTSASGCQASISASGTPSATLDSGFLLNASGVEGDKDAIFFYGANGKQGVSWGNGSSYQCVVPPVRRTPLQIGVGTPGACDGSFSYDLNARWEAKPVMNPGAGAVVQAELWYRDPLNTSNRKTSMSDAIEFTVCP